MPPTVILIRHAQALHNVAQEYTLHDPPLSALGETQCATLSTALSALPIAAKTGLIITSPMRRTLQTTVLSLQPLISRGVPVVLRAEWQENSAKPCDTGTSAAEMEKEWPQFDWSALDEVWPRKEGLYEYSERGLRERGVAAREWLRGRKEEVVVVVSHSGFLRVGVCGRSFENADFRVFGWEEGITEGGGRLVETKLTEGQGGLGKSKEGFFAMGPGDYPAVEVGAEKPQ